MTIIIILSDIKHSINTSYSWGAPPMVTQTFPWATVCRKEAKASRKEFIVISPLAPSLWVRRITTNMSFFEALWAERKGTITISFERFKSQIVFQTLGLWILVCIHFLRDTGVCEINTHPTCGQCRTPPIPPNDNVHGHEQSECNWSVK